MVWGTMYHITYSAPRNLNDSILAEMERVDLSLSMFNPLSTVSAINAGKSNRADAYMREVIEISQEISRISNGVFDPTVAPLVDLWGFGPTHRDSTATPSDSAITRALESVGILRCRLSIDGALSKPTPLTSFDFSAIAKGYGVQKVADLLARNGSRNFMVEIGGEVVLRGLNPRGVPWHIQIDAPDSGPAGHSSLTVRPFGPGLTAIASSGNYRNFRTDSLGNRYGHTISPLTGRPIQSDVLAATVILPGGDCARADALATAAMTQPADSAAAMLRRVGADAILVIGLPDAFKTLEINANTNPNSSTNKP